MPQRLVVVGASRAGLFAVEAARRHGYSGPITMIGAEPHLPYDRPPLSKQYLDSGPEPPPVPTYRTETMLRDELDIDLRLGAEATRLDPQDRTIWVGSEPIAYSAAVITTGAAPRTLPGTDGLEGVLTLRTLEDARAFRAGLEAGARIIIVGAGLIGSEAAAAVRKRGLPSVIVEAAAVPLVRAFGAQAGASCTRWHRHNGTELRTGVAVEAVLGSHRVEQVRLSDGSSLDADLVVVGTGVDPATGWLHGSGLTIADGIVCDETLSTGVSGVYAAGDVVRWRNRQFGQDMRLENWTSAAEQARVAVRNALDPQRAETFATVPYCWSDQYGARLQFAGVPSAEEVVTVTDAVEDGRYLALYRGGDELVGAFGLNARRMIPKLRSIIGRSNSWAEGLAVAGKGR
jgi:NADPH-dependent 2,4-dienoyl-CoA reductase/sulfur reductase-like enzyme